MNKRIIIQIPFNVQGFNIENETNKEWIKYRLKIFADYTLKSLMAQTNQYFTALLRCRDITIPFIKNEIEKILPDNIILVGVNECEEKIKELIVDYNYLYIVRLDSDDMYINTFIDMLHNYNPEPETEVLISQNCYAYEIYQKRLAHFLYPSPQSYVLIYKIKEYAEGKRHYLKNGHCGAILLKHELLSGNNYIDTVHKRNDSSTWKDIEGEKQYAYKGIPREGIKDEEEIKNILKDFGLEE